MPERETGWAGEPAIWVHNPPHIPEPVGCLAAPIQERIFLRGWLTETLKRSAPATTEGEPT